MISESYRLQQLHRIREVLAILSAPITPEQRHSASVELATIEIMSKPQPRQGALWGGA